MSSVTMSRSLCTKIIGSSVGKFSYNKHMFVMSNFCFMFLFTCCNLEPLFIGYKTKLWLQSSLKNNISRLLEKFQMGSNTTVWHFWKTFQLKSLNQLQVASLAENWAIRYRINYTINKAKIQRDPKVFFPDELGKAEGRQTSKKHVPTLDR